MLLYVNEFVKEQSISKRLMRNNHIAETNCCHRRLVGRLLSPKLLSIG